MNQQLIEQFEAERSRANIDVVANWAGTDARRISDLFQIALGNFGKVSESAMWALVVVADENDGILDKYASQIVHSLDILPTSGMRRMACRILMVSHVPEELDGRIVDFCFRMLEDQSSPVGLAANCVSLIALRLSRYPELKGGLRMLVADIIDRGTSVGFKSRARKLGLVGQDYSDND